MDILNTLGVNIKAVIIQGVGFLILLFVLKKYLFGKVSAIIKERSEGIKDTYAKVEKDRDEARKLTIEYQKKLSEAEVEVARRIQDAVNEGNRVCEEIIKRAREEVELMRIKAQEDRSGKEKGTDRNKESGCNAFHFDLFQDHSTIYQFSDG